MTKEEDGVEIKLGRDGATFWYLHGVVHRDDGPAVEYPNGEKWWFQFGKEHREDGPAIERADGSKQWYRDGWREVGRWSFDPRQTKSREGPPQENTALPVPIQKALGLGRPQNQARTPTTKRT